VIHTGGAVLTALGPLAANSNSSGGSSLGAFLPIILLVGVFYMFIIRPQRNRAKQAAENRRNVAPGVEVQTTFGMFATVVAVEDDAIVLEIAPGVHSRFSPQVVARVITPVDEDEADGEPETVDAPAAEAPADEVAHGPSAEQSAPAKA
jgi:preprotein translocase subunit YajC